MRLLTSLTLVMTLLSGGIVGDAWARERDRDRNQGRDQKHERYERRDGDRSGREESRGRSESRRDDARYDEFRRDESRGEDNPYFGGREASLIDRRSSSQGRSSSRMTAGQAARQAQQQYGGGRVLSVDSMGDGYRVKLLRDGDVRVVFIGDR